MITASAYLEQVVLNAEDTAKFNKTLAEIAEAAKTHRNLTGFFVQVRPGRFDPNNPNVYRALQIELHKYGWAVEIILLPSDLNPKLPGAWRITVTPNEEAYNNATVQLTVDPKSAS